VSSTTIAVMLKLAAAASSSSGPAWPALFIAVAGLVLSLTSVGWQVLAFIRSGSRVRVEMKYGTFLGQGLMRILAPEITQTMQDPNSAQSEQPIYLPNELVTALGPQLHGHLWLIAEISNVGRLPVTVQGCQWQTTASGTVERMPTRPGVSFPHRLEAHDQCIAVLDLHTIISMLDAPFGGTKTSGREVWPVIRLGNRRTVKGKRIQIPITSDPSQDMLMSDENPELPFRLTVDSVSHVAGRDGALVRGHIERGTVRVGDHLDLISTRTAGQLEPRRGQCTGVGKLNQPSHPSPQRALVGVLVSGLKQENVNPGDVLEAASSRRDST
jgi:hypothetical protein